MSTAENESRKKPGSWRKAARKMATGLLTVAALPGCHGSGTPAKTPALRLTTTSFQGNQIPGRFTCSGEGISPQLAWNAPPAGTASFALIVTDPDAPRGTFVHWVLFNLPAGARALAEGVPTESELEDGSRQGRNDFGGIGYGGPCPPGHAVHRYFFTLYALDTKLNMAAGATRAQVETSMQGHILAKGELMGRYQR